MSVRSILWQIIACALICFPSLDAHGAGADRRSTLESPSSPPVSGEYDCTGRGRLKSDASRKILDQAIRDALAILEVCEPCRQMFSGFEDPKVLLKWLDQTGRIVMSSEFPLGYNHQTFMMDDEDIKPFDITTAGAAVDLMGKRQGAMKHPCVYINPNAFIALDIPAEGYALYRVGRPEARAIAILHELGHVAGCLQYDGRDIDDTGRKSVENTDCVRKNSVPCKTFDPCVSVLQSPPPRLPRRRGGKD